MTTEQRPRRNAPGQGRKPEGRKRETIAMLPEVWAKVDAQRGKLSRGRYIEKRLTRKNARP